MTVVLQARDATGELEAESIRLAVDALRRGELVIVPTDTVYGIAADSANPVAIARLYTAKERPNDKSIPLLAASPAQAAAVADLTGDLTQRLIDRWWPGPLTVVVNATETIGPCVVAADGSVAVRVPADSVPRSLAQALGRPIAATSANKSGQPPALSCTNAVETLGPWVAVALDGGVIEQGQASTVADCRGEAPVVLRQGAAIV